MNWQAILEDAKQKDYFKNAISFVEQARLSGKVIYPPEQFVFHALDLTPFDKVKVVILAQDPYHGPSQAHGLAFSVQKGITTPPSLKNIYKAIKHDYPEFDIPNHGNLVDWAKQGILLLNSALTVEKAKPNSHANIGWHQLTDDFIKKLSDNREGLIFMLWGNFAQQKSVLIDGSKHTILRSAHPSPLAARKGFMTCGHFKECNRLLREKGETEINWQLALD